ncbi:MAG: thermonuclease family protein [bacterium]
MKSGRFLWGLLIGLTLGSSGSWLLLDASRPAVSTSGPGPSRASARESLTTIAAVIDGDTIRLQTGESVRLLGIDTPEKGEPYFEQAVRCTTDLVLGQPVRLLPCSKQKHDAYDRILAFVQAGHQDPGLELLGQGLARTLLIPPCGLERAAPYRKAEREAFRRERGIWSQQPTRRIPHQEAGRFVGCLMTVTGRVLKVHTGPKAVHLNFGANDRTDFTAVIFRKDLAALLQDGLQPPAEYAGRLVEVTGYLRSYGGPEIIVDSADQLIHREEGS